MNKKIAIVFVAALMLSSCALFNEYNQPVGSTETVITQLPPDAPVDITTIAEETPVELPAEMKGIPVVIGTGAKIVSYNTSYGNVEVLLDDGNTFSSSDILIPLEDFLNALIEKDANSLSQLLAASPEAADEILNSITVDGYEIKEIYAEKVEKQNYTYYEVSAHVMMNVTQSSIDRFPVGNNEYTICSGDAGGAVTAVSLRGQEIKELDFFNRDKVDKLASVCYAYALDFDNNEPSEIINDEYLINRCIMWNFDTNDNFNYEDGNGVSEEEFTAYIEKTLGIKVDDWSKYYAYEEFKSTNFNPPGRGRSWYYPLAESESDNEVTLTFYADTAYIIKAYSYTYTVEKNSDGSYRILTVNRSADYGFEPAMGSV